MVRGVPKHRFIAVLCCSLMLMGCRDKSDQPANEETAEAAKSISKLRSDLTKTKRQLADLQEDLQAAKDIRDELDKEVAQLTIERGNAIKIAIEAEQKISDLTDQFSELPENLKELEKELNEQNTLIESQQLTITEQQATIAEQQKVIAEQEETIAALDKIIQEQMAAEEEQQEVEQEEIPEHEPEVEEQE